MNICAVNVENLGQSHFSVMYVVSFQAEGVIQSSLRLTTGRTGHHLCLSYLMFHCLSSC